MAIRTIIKSCKCKSVQQDKMYGHQQRVMNRTNKCTDSKDEGSYKFRCTVCNEVR